MPTRVFCISGSVGARRWSVLPPVNWKGLFPGRNVHCMSLPLDLPSTLFLSLVFGSPRFSVPQPIGPRDVQRSPFPRRPVTKNFSGSTGTASLLQQPSTSGTDPPHRRFDPTTAFPDMSSSPQWFQGLFCPIAIVSFRSYVTRIAVTLVIQTDRSLMAQPCLWLINDSMPLPPAAHPQRRRLSGLNCRNTGHPLE